MQRLLEEDPEEVGRALQVGRDLPDFKCHRKDATQGARSHQFAPLSRFADGQLVSQWVGEDGELIHYRRGLFEAGEVCTCSSCLRARKRDQDTPEGPLQRSCVLSRPGEWEGEAVLSRPGEWEGEAVLSRPGEWEG
ncbi:hypothetical protein CYMTET_24119, partial [Cymbomonas tetramitiformis]